MPLRLITARLTVLPSPGTVLTCALSPSSSCWALASVTVGCVRCDTALYVPAHAGFACACISSAPAQLPGGTGLIGCLQLSWNTGNSSGIAGTFCWGVVKEVQAVTFAHAGMAPNSCRCSSACGQLQIAREGGCTIKAREDMFVQTAACTYGTKCRGARALSSGVRPAQAIHLGIASSRRWSRRNAGVAILFPATSQIR